MKKSVAFAIHDLNTWGGQDRSTLEIAKRISRNRPVKIYSYTLDGFRSEEWGDVQWCQVKPEISRPAVLKYNAYMLQTAPFLINRDFLVQSTGTCSAISDVVQIQFLEWAWQKEMQKHSMAASAEGFRKVYHLALSKYKVALEKICYSKKKHYIAISKSIKSDLQLGFNIPDGNISVVPHGVDSELFCPASGEQKKAIRKEFRFADDDFIFLQVGAVNPRKAVLETLRAFSIVKTDKPEKVKLLFVGGGETSAGRAHVKNLGLEGRVFFAGKQKQSLDYYQASDVFLCPSFYEPFGLVVLEAASCGLPAIISKNSGAAELFEDGKNGLLLSDPRNVLDYSGKMQNLLDSAELRQVLTSEGRKIAEQRSWDIVASEYESVYEELCK